MKSRQFIIVILVLLAFAAAAFAWNYYFVLQPREVRLSPTGEARHNHFLTLERSLKAMGRRADSAVRLDLNLLQIKSDDVIFLDMGSYLLTDSQSALLLEKIKQGAHLVASYPRQEIRSLPLLDGLGVELDFSDDYDCVNRIDSIDYFDDNFFCNNVRLELAENSSLKALHVFPKSSDANLRLGHFKMGLGTIWLLPSLEFFHNFELPRPHNIDMAARVLDSLPSSGQYHLIYSSEFPSLLSLIWRHAYTVVIALALALLAWLVSRSQSIGPLQPANQLARRALLDHIRASGEFLFRRGRSMLLYSAVRERLLTRLRDRWPELAALPIDDQINALEKQTGMGHADISHALKPQDLGRADKLVAAISTLNRMREIL